MSGVVRRLSEMYTDGLVLNWMFRNAADSPLVENTVTTPSEAPALVKSRIATPFTDTTWVMIIVSL